MANEKIPALAPGERRFLIAYAYVTRTQSGFGSCWITVPAGQKMDANYVCNVLPADLGPGAGFLDMSVTSFTELEG